MDYPVFVSLFMISFVGFIGFVIWAKLSYEHEDFLMVLSIICFVVCIVCGCLSMATEQTYSSRIAAETVAQHFQVPVDSVVIDEGQCISSGRYSCVTWRSQFHVPGYGGEVTYNNNSATIDRIWVGDAPPIENIPLSNALWMLDHDVLKLLLLPLYGIGFLLGLYTLATVWQRRRLRGSLASRAA